MAPRFQDYDARRSRAIAISRRDSRSHHKRSQQAIIMAVRNPSSQLFNPSHFRTLTLRADHPFSSNYYVSMAAMFTHSRAIGQLEPCLWNRHQESNIRELMIDIS